MKQAGKEKFIYRGLSALRISYLVGGLRIGLGPHSTTPGPRNHILNFTNALASLGASTELFLVSDLPVLGRISSMREGEAAQKSRREILRGDLLRICAMMYSGAAVTVASMRQAKPDVIYERLAVMQSLSSFHWAKRSALRVIESNGIMSRETANDRNALVLERLARSVEIHAYRKADAIITVSQPLADELVNFASVSHDKIMVVPNAIPLDVAQSEVAEPPMGRTVIGFSGAIVAWQQLDVLVRAASKVLEDPDSRLYLDIIGDGPELSQLRALVESLGIGGRVSFHGSLPAREVYKLMRTWTVGYSGHKKSAGERMYHSPLKLYEYAGFGLGALCTYSDDAQALNKSGMPVWFFQTEEELRHRLTEVLTDGESLLTFRRTGVQRVRNDHSWETRITSLFSHL